MTSALINKPSVPDSDEIALGRIIGELLDHKKMIAIITGLFVVVAILYVLFSTPIYQADALVQVEQKQGNAILENLSQVLPDVQPQSEPEIALIQSRMVLGKTVDDLNLQAGVEQDYFPIFGKGWARLTGAEQGRLKVSNLYIPQIGSNKQQVTLKVIDKATYQVSGKSFEYTGVVGELLQKPEITILVDAINASPGISFTINYQSQYLAINDLLKRLVVADEGKDTGMLTLTLTGEDPVEISEILNSIIQNYLDQNIEREAAQDAKSLDFLQTQLPKVRSDLDDAEDKLNAYRKQKDSIDLPLEAKSVLDQIVNVDNQLNQLTFREAEISKLYTPDHPTYKALLEKRGTLEKERDALNKKVSSMPSTQQEVIRLSRNVDSGKAVYMQLLTRQQELEIAKSSAIGNVRIIDHSVTAPIPVKPKKILVVAVSVILGIFVSIAVVLFKSFFHRGIESPEQLEILGISVYASIPISDWLIKNNHANSVRKSKGGLDEKVSFLAIDNPADISIEALRSLRTSIYFTMQDSPNNILMISGPSPNAGKSFVSGNLSAVIAQANKRVLLIDGDMRKGIAHKMLKANNERGLSELISSDSSFESSIKRIESAKFDFIPRGKVTPNPAELLMHPKFSALLSWASKNYDLVIIDTPPILAVTDAAIIGRLAGTSLLVARFEQNTVKEIEVSLRRFQQSGVMVNGCILNGIVKKASSHYGYGYNHYGYDYSDKKQSKA
ncbi:polysaccharide biosynthesis tyrosine autokinase [Pantoea cypripedii]|uniref:polysaccharide biosynthesis tyrosine autokinase n=1 Tax=Pantoea cypripedii TaxID=55209 RepID=UPI001AE34F77|nr:polysaccharide biosynthesis tyrosine autokinase [Pantoea cypripedii]MBP2200333.1 tyrosine-protein kinase Etk/Wzc [Pantoea cypripedii]